MNGYDPKRLGMPEDWLDKFHEETAGADVCIVSCEGFSSYSRPIDVASYFPRNQTQIVMYVREPVGHVASFYKNKVKIRNMTMNLRDFAESYRLPNLSVANRWAAVFGRENVEIRRSDCNDIVTDFMNLLGLELDSALPRHRYELNLGIAGNLLFVKRVMNCFITLQQCNQFATAMNDLAHLDHSFRGTIPVDQKTVELIAHRSQDDLQEIEQRFGLTVKPSEKPVEAPPSPDPSKLARDFASILSQAQESHSVLTPTLERIAGIFASAAVRSSR